MLKTSLNNAAMKMQTFLCKLYALKRRNN